MEKTSQTNVVLTDVTFMGHLIDMNKLLGSILKDHFTLALDRPAFAADASRGFAVTDTQAITHLVGELQAMEGRIEGMQHEIAIVHTKLDSLFSLLGGKVPSTATPSIKRTRKGSDNTLRNKKVTSSSTRGLVTTHLNTDQNAIIDPVSIRTFAKVKRFNKTELANLVNTTTVTIRGYLNGTTKARPARSKPARILASKMHESGVEVNYISPATFNKKVRK